MNLYITSHNGQEIALRLHKNFIFDTNKVALTLGQGRKVYSKGGSPDVTHTFESTFTVPGRPNNELFRDYVTLTELELNDLTR